jgi:hypothetical protein
MSAAGRLIGLRFVDMLKNVAGPLCCATCMAVAIWLSDQWLLVELAHWLRLAVDVLVGTSVYWFLIARFQLKAWDEVRELILETDGRRSDLIRWLLGYGSRVRSD